MTNMILEDDLLDAVQAFFEERSWQLVSRARGREHGTDLVMARGDRRLRVEGKGATSAIPGTGRYGSPFNGSQRRSHVGKALVELLPWYGRDDLALALPDDHQDLAERLRPALNALGVCLILVNGEGKIVEANVE